jgi:exodeoxyribonuclease VII small subunit
METPETREPTLEDSIRRLEQIVADLERGDQELETALESYEEGVLLAKRCLERLREAELRLERLSELPDETEPN